MKKACPSDTWPVTPTRILSPSAAMAKITVIVTGLIHVLPSNHFGTKAKNELPSVINVITSRARPTSPFWR